MIKAIETEYGGIKFRSRLEAHWALLFDVMGIEYEYEPEGFEVDGTKYLPDFLLHGISGRTGRPGLECENGDVWVEVKGFPTEQDKEKIRLFSKYKPIYVVGNIPIPRMNGTTNCSRAMMDIGDNDSYFFTCATIDGDQFGLALCIGEDGNPWLIDSNWNQCKPDDELTDIAYKAARLVKFDHGQTPTRFFASRVLAVN